MVLGSANYGVSERPSTLLGSGREDSMLRRPVLFLFLSIIGIASLAYADNYGWGIVYYGSDGHEIGGAEGGCGSFARWGDTSDNSVQWMRACSPTWQGDGSWCQDFGGWWDELCFTEPGLGQHCGDVCVVP